MQKITKRIQERRFAISHILNYLIKYKWLFAILLIGLGLRIPHLFMEFTDHHSWKSLRHVMAATNFYYYDDYLHTRVDFFFGVGDAQSAHIHGLVSWDEAPLLNYLVLLSYYLFGVHIWSARIVPMLFSIGSMLLLFKLGKETHNEKMGLFAALFFAISPLEAYFAGNVQGEPLMVFSGILLLYILITCLRKPMACITDIFIIILAMTLCIVSKLSFLFILPPIVLATFYIYLKKENIWRVITPVIVVLIATIISLVAINLLDISMVINWLIGRIIGFFKGSYISPGHMEAIYFTKLVFYETIGNRILIGFSPIVFLFFGSEIITIFKKYIAYKVIDIDDLIITSFLAGVLLKFLIVSRAVYVHDYYILPLIIPVVYLASKNASSVNIGEIKQYVSKKILILGAIFAIITILSIIIFKYALILSLLLIIILLFARHFPTINITKNQIRMISLFLIILSIGVIVVSIHNLYSINANFIASSNYIKSHTEKGDYIIAHHPAFMYYSERAGFMILPKMDKTWLDGITKEYNITYMVTDNRTIKYLKINNSFITQNFEAVYVDGEGDNAEIVYKLIKKNKK